jgi:hypothetical protein
MTTTYRAVLSRETAHLAQPHKDQVARLLGEAVLLARACPRVTPQALSLKLLTLFGGERWVRELVAKAAIEAATNPPALHDAAPVSPALAA